MTSRSIAVLGPVVIRNEGVEIDLGTRRHRQLLAALAMSSPEAVPGSVLIDRIWGAAAPASAVGTLHGYIAGLRRLIEPDRSGRHPATVLVTEGSSYALRVASEARDDTRFQSLVTSARGRLAVVGDHLRPRASVEDRETVELALDELDDALALWRGVPYVELGDDPAAASSRARLEDLRRAALELRAVGQLALGRHDIVRSELEARTSEYPLHERWWALRAVALARESRQGDALAALDQLRQHLADELGVDPSPPLQELRTAILRQDHSVVAPDLRPAPAVPVQQATATVRTWAWQLTGREADSERLSRALDVAEQGRANFAVLSGVAGIGKSRLVQEIALQAMDRSWAVAVGTCTQDASAPPLWPWLSILSALGTPFEVPGPGWEDGGAFQMRADLVNRIRQSALTHPLVIVLEDLHWADASTLAVLRLLVQTVSTDRILVIATWRSGSGSRADLGAVADAFARRHALRLELTGLDLDATRQLCETVSGASVSHDQAVQLHQRTGGSPFFAVEFARLVAGGEDSLEQLLESGRMPTTVADVVGQRLATVAEDVQSTLRTAAVIGHSFDLETLGDVIRRDPDQVLDLIEPAVRADLLVEEAPEVFRFSHALVADYLLSTMSATRLARTHQVVAEILERRPGRESEVARHWQAAGQRHAAKAWRALRSAADEAARVYAHVEAAELLEAAVATQEADPDAGPADQYELLARAIEIYRAAAMHAELVAAVERSIAIAERMGDSVRSASAAVQSTHRFYWRSAPFGSVNPVVVGALRKASASLPASEWELRCRVLVSLANELRHSAPLSERLALCAEARDVAGDQPSAALHCDLLLQEVISTITPAVLESRLRLAQRATDLADGVADRHVLMMALALQTVMLGELGRVKEMWAAARRTRQLAAELRSVFIGLVLDEIELAWAAAAGRFEDADVVVRRIERHLASAGERGGPSDLSVEQTIDMFALHLWRDRPLDALPELRSAVAAGYPMQVFIVLALARSGRMAEAAREHTSAELHQLLERDELSFGSPLWCAAAEVAYRLHDVALAKHAYARLSPLAGRSSGANGLFLGPVDLFLAFASAGTGDLTSASAHADRAVELVTIWHLPHARAWIDAVRQAGGF